MFESSWNEIPPTSYIVEARKRIRIIWLGKPVVLPERYGLLNVELFSTDMLANIFDISKTKARECIVSSANDWIDFVSERLYCPVCEDGKNWNDIDGKKLSFLDWMSTSKVRNDSKYIFEKERFSDNIIITIFDTTKQKRLIVDGINRAAALTIASETGVDIPSIKVLECHGDRIDVLFPCDIHQL
ncbi:MAG TPA: hypothetical protein VJ729_01820 [Nitrososphaeraceae archaeon]|nr:hypothetical protein [Nitrososphaeraceae archaeon]